MVGKTPKDPAIETVERCRRIETRVTQIAIGLGIRTDQQRPEFDAGSISGGPASVKLPSPHSSLKEIIDSIPPGWHEPVEVFIGDRHVAMVTRRSG